MKKPKPSAWSRIQNIILGILIALTPMLLAVFLVTQFGEEDCDEDCQEATPLISTNVAINTAISASATALANLPTASSPTQTRVAQTEVAFSETQGVAQPATLEAQVATQADIAQQENATGTAIAITMTPSAEPCAFVPNNIFLPELNDLIAQALEQGEIENVSVTASAYGEDCIGQQSNTVQYFAAQQTDFVVALIFNQLQNRALIGERLAAVLDVLLTLPEDQVPGPNPGQLTINVQSDENITLTISSDMAAARAARADNLTGEDLLAALSEE